jgi:hypothetical protein
MYLPQLSPHCRRSFAALSPVAGRRSPSPRSPSPRSPSPTCSARPLQCPLQCFKAGWALHTQKKKARWAAATRGLLCSLPRQRPTWASASTRIVGCCGWAGDVLFFFFLIPFTFSIKPVMKINNNKRCSIEG